MGDKNCYDRVLSAYTSVLDKEPTSDSELLEVLHESQDKSEYSSISDTTSDENEPNDNSSSPLGCCKFSKQFNLFAIYFLLTHFALEVLYPFVSLYLKQLGFNAKEIGIIGCVQPFFALFYTPLIGYITDKFSISKYVLCASLIGTAIAHMALYYVPNIRTNACVDIVTCNISADVPVDNNTDCLTFVEEDSSTTSSHRYLHNAHDLQVVFIYLIFANMAAQLLGALWFPLGNGVVLTALGPEKRNYYGFFKGFGALGNLVGVVVAGVSLQLTVHIFKYCFIDVEETNFMIVFLLYSGAMIIASPIAWMMYEDGTHKNEYEKVQTILIEDTEKTYSFSTFLWSICHIRYSSAILVITWLSTVTGKMRVFDYWYINFIGGSYLMMGWGGMISKIFGTVTFFSLPYLNDRIGHIPMLVFACVFVGAGCIVASLVENVIWMVIPLLSREVVTAIYSYSSGAFLGNAVEEQYQGTLQSLMAALTFGIGKGVGSFLGGGIMEDLSPEMSYYIFAIVSFVMAGFLVVVQCLTRILEEKNQQVM